MRRPSVRAGDTYSLIYLIIPRQEAQSRDFGGLIRIHAREKLLRPSGQKAAIGQRNWRDGQISSNWVVRGPRPKPAESVLLSQP